MRGSAPTREVRRLQDSTNAIFTFMHIYYPGFDKPKAQWSGCANSRLHTSIRHTLTSTTRQHDSQQEASRQVIIRIVAQLLRFLWVLCSPSCGSFYCMCVDNCCTLLSTSTGIVSRTNVLVVMRRLLLYTLHQDSRIEDTEEVPSAEMS